MSQFAKPTGFFGKILAKGMARGHKEFYKNTLKAINPKKDDKYLEIGFGSGIFINKYMSHVSKIAGLDYSEDMVKLASDINRKLVESGKAEFKQGYASSFPWPDNEFTVVAAIEVFFFLDETEKTLKEIFRILKPGGRLIIEMSFNKDDGVDHKRHIKKMNLKLYSGDEMKKLLKKAGFNDITIEFFKAFWIPIKGHIVPKGMVVKGIKN
ncbi:MAG: class I SAM-dependent methyltransferase [Promethearchaeota archaeon]|jgi:ubiquinone/menaquinone biosynthesis C-methylase UbiE